MRARCIVRVPMRTPDALCALEDAVRGYVRCEAGVQCALLQTMTYTRFRWRWIAGCAGGVEGLPAGVVHLSSELKVVAAQGVCELWATVPGGALPAVDELGVLGAPTDAPTDAGEDCAPNTAHRHKRARKGRGNVLKSEGGGGTWPT